MKKILLIALLALSFAANAELETFYYDNGQKNEINYKNGKYHGLWTSWYKNGQKKHEWNYKNGKEHGLSTGWHENGQKESEINYKNGKYHGLWTSWYKNGQKKHEWNYKNGKKHGLSTGWHENGQKESEINHKNGKYHGLWTKWYENVRAQKMCYDNGERIALSNCGGSNYADADDSNSYDAGNSSGGGFLNALLKVGTAYVDYKTKKSDNSYTPPSYTSPSNDNSYSNTSNSNSYSSSNDNSSSNKWVQTASANNCIKREFKEFYGKYNNVSLLVNKCNFKVVVNYCIIDADDSGQFSRRCDTGRSNFIYPLHIYNKNDVGLYGNDKAMHFPEINITTLGPSSHIDLGENTKEVEFFACKSLRGKRVRIAHNIKGRTKFNCGYQTADSFKTGSKPHGTTR